jgi:hypothetical protein
MHVVSGERAGTVQTSRGGHRASPVRPPLEAICYVSSAMVCGDCRGGEVERKEREEERGGKIEKTYLEKSGKSRLSGRHEGVKVMEKVGGSTCGRQSAREIHSFFLFLSL